MVLFGVIYFLLIFPGLFIVVLSGSVCFLWVLDGYFGFLVFLEGSLWFLVVFGGSGEPQRTIKNKKIKKSSKNHH